MILIRVDDRVRIPLLGLPNEVISAIKSAHTHENPSWHTKRKLGIPLGGEKREIATWRVDGGDLTVPRGGMGRVRQVLQAAGVAAFSVIDARTEGSHCAGVPQHLVELRAYQQRMVLAAMQRENCILRAGTGSGKTCVAFALASRLGVNVLVILPTMALYKQWAQRAQSELGLSGDRLGMIRGKIRRLRPLTIAMQQTLFARGVDEELCEYFGAVIVDEVQGAAARSVFAIVDPFPARYRIGISANERRKDKKEFLIRDLFGDVALEVGREELEAAGHIMGVEIRVVPTRFRADWYGLPGGAMGDDKHIDFVRLLDEITRDDDRNALVLEHLAREVATGVPAIVLSHRLEHCRMIDRDLIARGVRSGLLIGGDENAKEFDRTRSGLLDGSRQVGVGTYLALGYGVDLPAVGIGLATTPIAANPQTFNQVRGRLCRTSKDKAKPRLTYFWDEHVFPSHLRMIVSQNAHVTVWSRNRWCEARQYLRGR